MKRRRAPLGELCSLIKGSSPISKTPPGPYPLVTTSGEHKTADTFQFDAEAVCIPLISSTGHGHASLKRVHYQVGKFALANLLAAAVVKHRSVLSAQFLARYLMFTKDRLIVPLMTGAANMSISIDRLATVPVEFPSLAEQTRIVNLLDETDELRKLRAEADRSTANLIPALFHKMFGDTGLRCQTMTIEDAVGQFIDYRGKTPVKSLSGVPLVTARIVKSGRILPATEFIREEIYDEWMTRGLPKLGDVLFTMEAPLGEVAIVDDVRIALAQRILLMRPRADLLDSRYFMTALKLPLVWKQIEERANSTTVRGIRQAELRKVQIPVPPLPLQKEFANRVTEIRALETQQAASRERLDALFQSMLHRAFRGEL
jgi:restriction endonuclease S subunit